MVLPRADAAFARIAAVVAGGNKLEVNAFGAQEIFHFFGGLIVKANFLDGNASFFELIGDLLVGFQNGCRSARRQRLCMDGVTVVVVQHKDIFVTSTGWNHELTGEIRVGLARDFDILAYCLEETTHARSNG